jgi:hypothetical protein
MKKIEYEVKHDDKLVIVKITKQTHREGAFGKNNNGFDCKNGITLASVACPANGLFHNCIFFRGDSLSQDKDEVLFNANEFELFKECVKEYNKCFSK